MATKSLNNPFALLDTVGDDDVPKPQSAVRKPAAKPQPKSQEPPKPKGPVVGSELKEAKPKQQPQPKQPKVTEEKVSKDTPKEEQFQKVPEKKKNADHDGQKAPKKHRSRHGEGEKSGAYASGANRVFERKSGTGRGYENKKGGAGKGNWGNHSDDLNTDIKEAQAAHEHVEATSKVSVVEAPAEPTTTAVAPPATATTATTTAPQTTPQTTPVETALVTVATPPPATEKEDEKSISYAEWLKKSEKAEVPLPRSLRTAGEGIDDTSGWAKIEVQRTDDKPVVVAVKKEDKKEKQKEKKEDKKENKKPTTAAVPLDKVFNLTVKVEEKEERNFKKGPRGDKEKGKGRGRGKRAGAGVSSPNRIQNANKKQEEFTLNANDAVSFPSLSPNQAKHADVTTPQVPVTTQATTQPQQTTTPPNPST